MPKKAKFQDEDEFQKSFDDLKVNYTPSCCLTVTVLRCRDVSVSYIGDKLDTPDPQFVITCPKLNGLNRFKTTCKSNSPTCEINETFRFVLPENLSPDEAFPVKIELYDADILVNDYLGAKTIDVSKMAIGDSMDKTLKYGDHGEADVTISKEKRLSADIRLSVGLHKKERAYRKKRFAFVRNALQKLLPASDAPKSVEETPVVSMVCSGGGYRAAIGMCGAMEAIKDAGLMDALTYAIGLSGSAWYLTSAYAAEGMTAEKQADFHSTLRENVQTSILTDFINPIHLANYRSYISQKARYGQPASFVDFFGYTIGKHLLGEENIGKCLTDLQPYVMDAKVPFPLFASLNVRNTVAASKYHAYLDMSPFEIGFPKFGMGVDPSQYGSAFSGGILSRKCPELPLHFIQGMCGCAFSILINQLLTKGGEKSDNLLEHIDKVRTTRSSASKEKNTAEIEFDSDASGDTDDDMDVDDEVEDANKTQTDAPVDVPRPANKPADDEADAEEEASYFTRCKDVIMYMYHYWRPAKAITDKSAAAKTEATQAENQTSTDGGSILSQFNLSFLSNRDALIGRTAKVFNVAHAFEPVQVFCMNPFSTNNETKDSSKHMASLTVETNKKISVRKEVISVADAGVLKNVPTDLALRPQRQSDILIVMDFNAYSSDSKFDYMPLLATAAHAEIQGLKFPNINFKEVTEMPPTEFFLIEGDEDTPTILWFTLSNKKFRAEENYSPRFSKDFTTGNAFNDFPVFDTGGSCSTFKFDYNNEEFDRLRDLMYYNVNSHIHEIKEALAKAVVRRRNRTK